MPRVRRNDKRDRLVQAADKLIYEKTFHTTTLADIAKLAGVPLGNVYYYFKTKEEIVMAVIKRRQQLMEEQFQAWAQLSSVSERLKAFIQQFVEDSETLARFGCATGSLCQELGKHGGAIGDSAASLLKEMIAWTQKQFREMGKSDEDSHRLAEHFIANIQGMNLLTLTFKQPNFCQRQSEALKAWVDTL
ncbi:MAG: TetR family transcriptional regulator [Legionellales bacterium]|nr:TetR family transcriptional regulator [Legionellales bacterium]|tara:strand:- start:290 stop:859 length:570 start_codon:yes stop_codon:yes gene_type:complete